MLRRARTRSLARSRWATQLTAFHGPLARAVSPRLAALRMNRSKIWHRIGARPFAARPGDVPADRARHDEADQRAPAPEVHDRDRPLAAAAEGAEAAVGQGRVDPAMIERAVDPVEQFVEAAGEQPREQAAAGGEAAVARDQMFAPLQHRLARCFASRHGARASGHRTMQIRCSRSRARRGRSRKSPPVCWKDSGSCPAGATGQVHWPTHDPLQCRPQRTRSPSAAPWVGEQRRRRRRQAATGQGRDVGSSVAPYRRQGTPSPHCGGSAGAAGDAGDDQRCTPVDAKGIRPCSVMTATEKTRRAPRSRRAGKDRRRRRHPRPG